jgi:hypothetical protein
LKPVLSEKYVGGVRIDEAPEQSAHHILAQHLTNVSPVTAQVIQRALEEHSNVLAELGSRPGVLSALPAMPAIDECEKSLKQLIDATDLLALAVAKIRENTMQALDKVGALRPTPLDSELTEAMKETLDAIRETPPQHRGGFVLPITQDGDRFKQARVLKIEPAKAARKGSKKNGNGAAGK